jgi:hypothetical protein
MNRKGSDIMATQKDKNKSYEKIENIVMRRVFALEDENARLREELTIANAKLSVYERMDFISDSKMQMGFRTSNNN